MSVKIVNLNVAVAVEDDDDTPKFSILRAVADALRGSKPGIVGLPGVINFSARISHVERAPEAPSEVGSSR